MALLCLFGAMAASAPAQQPTFEVALRDGRVLTAARVTGSGATWRLTEADGKAVEVAHAQVLAVHGRAVELPRLPAAHLVGGETVRGLLTGGDAGGDQLELQSPVLGRMTLRVDRLDCLVLQGAEPEWFELPAGADEVLFQKAALGFDRLVGSVHQFGESGIRFQPQGEPQPRWFAVRDLAALRLRGGEAGKHAADAEVLTRTGDRLRVQWRGWREDRWVLGLEDGRELALPPTDLGSLHLLGGGVVQVADLTPVAVRESAADGDALLPWRRDAAVGGGPLAAGGRAYGRGLGVHSRCRLSFAAPAVPGAFWTRVAFDDSARTLPVRGSVAVRVLVGDTVVFEEPELRVGMPVRSTGLIPVRPGQEVTLDVDFGKGRDLGDRVDWLMPVFLPASQAAGGGDKAPR